MDLDLLTVPTNPAVHGSEYFDPVHAWDGAPSQVYVNVIRTSPQSVTQIGYDISTGRTWLRSLPAPGAAWSEWVTPGGGSPDSPPVPLTAFIAYDLHTIVIHFDLPLDGASVPAPSAFTVTRDAEVREITSVGVSGSDVVLHLLNQTGSGVVVCSYAPPSSGKLRSVDGVDVAAFSDLPVSV